MLCLPAALARLAQPVLDSCGRVLRHIPAPVRQHKRNAGAGSDGDSFASGRRTVDVYAALYLAQFLFNTLYDNPQPVWDVMNYVSALAIFIALAANFAHMRSQSGGDEQLNLARLGAHVLFYANAVLAIWFFRNWIYVLTLDEGASASVPVDVIWDFVAVIIPLVLATTGRRLWQRGV